MWKRYIEALGVSPDVPMSSKIADWWGWYRADNAWYASSERADDGRTYRVDRTSIKPAKMVCQEWASLLLNERTLITTDSPAANDWLDGWLRSSRFLINGQDLVERACGLGTAAWVVRTEGLRTGHLGSLLPSPDARIVAARYDARSIIPLTFDSETCTECAFVSHITVSGKRYTQLQVHRKEPSGYVIENILFDDERRVRLDGISEVIRTQMQEPLFALVRTGLSNTYWESSPFGVAVTDDAIGAVRLVDSAVDNMYRDIWLGQKMLFLDETMLAKDARGDVVVPRERDQQLFRRTETSGMPGERLIEEYNPSLRVEDNRSALVTGLELLGLRTGFGGEYFSLEGASGLMTATQVVAEQSDLFRSIRKHENQLEPAVRSIVTAAALLARRLSVRGASDAFSQVTVAFDDSVIEDAGAQRRRDLDDVAAGAMPLWEYRAKWYGEDEATARSMVIDGELPGEEF